MIPGRFPNERCSEMAPPMTCEDQLGGAASGHHRTADRVESWPTRRSPILSRNWWVSCSLDGCERRKWGHASAGAHGAGGSAAAGRCGAGVGASSDVRPGRRGLQGVRAVGGHLVAPLPGGRQAVRQPRTRLGELLDASARGAALQAMTETEHPFASQPSPLLPAATTFRAAQASRASTDAPTGMIGKPRRLGTTELRGLRIMPCRARPRQRRSMITRDKKSRHRAPELADMPLVLP